MFLKYPAPTIDELIVGSYLKRDGQLFFFKYT